MSPASNPYYSAPKSPTAKDYLYDVERWADNALGGAERPAEQAASAIFAQVATAKAIAALAAAALEVAAAMKSSPPSQSP